MALYLQSPTQVGLHIYLEKSKFGLKRRGYMEKLDTTEKKKKEDQEDYERRKKDALIFLARLHAMRRGKGDCQ